MTAEITYDTRIKFDEFHGRIGVAHIAFRDDATRERHAEILLREGAWSRIISYTDYAGPALQVVRNPLVGPIRPATCVEK